VTAFDCQTGVASCNKSTGGGETVVGAEGFELCVAFLLGASVGYAIRAAISSVRRAEARRQRGEELARSHASEYSAALDRQMVVQEQASSQSLTASPALTGAAAAIIREIESEIGNPRVPTS
jgi:hypothetical protein